MIILYATILFLIVSLIYISMMYILLKKDCPECVNTTCNNICNNKIYISKSKYEGRGVFTSRDIKKGEVVEVCPIILEKAELIPEGSTLKDYTFSSGSDQYVVIAFGYGSLYNHSDEYNVSWKVDKEAQTITFTAKNDISKGEELFVTYGPRYWSTRKIKKEV